MPVRSNTATNSKEIKYNSTKYDEQYVSMSQRTNRICLGQ